MRALLLAGVLAVLPDAARAIPAGAVQTRKLEAGKSALERLRADPRRRRYREGWETVLRTLDAAVKVAPRGPRAAEAALLAGHARAELWKVSRSRRDGRAAISALRKVDADYAGPAGAEALALASRVAAGADETKERTEIAMRIAARSLHREGTEHAPSPATESHDDAGNEGEPEMDAQASKAVEQIVEDAKARASVRAGDQGGEEEEETEEVPPEPEAPADPPMRSTPIVRAVKSAVAALTESEDAPARAAKARDMRSAALGSGTSLAAQLGLKVRRVVVDAGHGGRDTGAIGARGVREKDLALAIAKKVAARLKVLGFQVVMTRTKDVFVSLDDRTRIANEARADLFVSIHCNAARRRKLEGVETWTLNVASNRYAARLAAFENAEADRTVSDLRLILADLATKANASDARDLAQSVQSSLVRTLRSRVGPVRDHGVKQALFHVLLGTRMPSILVETGFISNPAEEVRLKSGRFQDGTAEAIARGVKDFVDSRRRLARAP